MRHNHFVTGSLRPGLAGIAAVKLSASLLCCSSPISEDVQVRPGIEVLLSDSMHLVDGHRVGLLTNQTGVNSQGTHDVDVLLDAGVNLTAIFSPEHGFRGELDQPTVEHSVDSATGLPVFSLYDSTVTAPTPEMLELVDVLLVDLQDIGARTYTYITAALETMRTAAHAEIPVIVLDRPNPIGGELVQGPMRDPGLSSDVGRLPVPLRHGLTMGEMALFGNDMLEIGADLAVVPAAAWRRDQWFDATGLPWIKPSPNMPDLESATHYPGIVLFEGTNVSVGRGTPIAFQVLGAPWFDPAALLERISDEPGVSVSDTTFTPLQPTDRKYGDTLLPGLRFRVTDRAAYDPTRLAIRLFRALRDVHGDSLQLRPGLDRLAGSTAVRSCVESDTGYEELFASWESRLAEFERSRRPYLIYQ